MLFGSLLRVSLKQGSEQYTVDILAQY